MIWAQGYLYHHLNLIPVCTTLCTHYLLCGYTTGLTDSIIPFSEDDLFYNLYLQYISIAKCSVEHVHLECFHLSHLLTLNLLGSSKMHIIFGDARNSLLARLLTSIAVKIRKIPFPAIL